MQFRALISTGSTPSSSAIFGHAGSAALLRSINETMGSTSFFGSVHDQHSFVYNQFVTNIVQPVQATIVRLEGAVQAATQPNVFRALTTPDDFTIVPPVMYEPLLMYPPMLRMLEQGRIAGWDYVADNLKGNEDTWGRLISNGVVDDVLDAHASDEDFICAVVHDSDDPDWDLEQVDAVEAARRTIDYILEHTNYDPTAYPLERS